MMAFIFLSECGEKINEDPGLMEELTGTIQTSSFKMLSQIEFFLFFSPSEDVRRGRWIIVRGMEMCFFKHMLHL